MKEKEFDTDGFLEDIYFADRDRVANAKKAGEIANITGMLFFVLVLGVLGNGLVSCMRHEDSKEIVQQINAAQYEKDRETAKQQVLGSVIQCPVPGHTKCSVINETVVSGKNKVTKTTITHNIEK